MSKFIKLSEKLRIENEKRNKLTPKQAGLEKKESSIKSLNKNKNNFAKL